MKRIGRLRRKKNSGAPSLGNLKAVLFDFDGTLADSLELSYEIMSEIGKKKRFSGTRPRHLPNSLH